jgi:hypothetical protein
MRRLAALFLILGALGGVFAAGASATHFTPKERALILIIAKPELCREVKATIRKYGYEAAEAGFELAFAERPAYATPAVFHWVVKLC